MKEKALLLICAVFAGCATTPSAPQTAAKPKKTEWDYARIRDTRQAEEAQTPPVALLNRDAEEDCAVLTRDQMIRSKASGCRPMDPREGGGPDAFCCPRE